METTSANMLSLPERILYHQIHPLKLSVDSLASVVSTWLLWQHVFLLGMLAAFLPAIGASVVMLRWMGFERQRDSAFGRYVAYHMTHIAEAVRFAGQIVVWGGAWVHLGWVIAAGIAVFLFGWTYSLPWWRSRVADE